MSEFAGFLDLTEGAKGSLYRLILDEDLLDLESALEDEGYTVHVLPKGLKDDQIKRKLRGAAFITRNSKHFVRDAVGGDYDIIGVEDIQFIDSRPDKSNQTVQKIAKALRQSRLSSRKGNFLLRIYNDGHSVLKAVQDKAFLPEEGELTAEDV